MLDFNKIKYNRVSFEDTSNNINTLIVQLKESSNYEQFLEICKKVIVIQNHIEEMYDYADIRNMRNLNDEFFKKEMDYWNEYKPKFDVLFVPFYQIIMESKYKEKLSKVMPTNFFYTIEFQMKITSEDIIELQQKENQLKTCYRELNRSKIMYDGEEQTIGKISEYFLNKDRNIRKKAHDAINDYYYSNQKDYDHILYELVNVRNEQAKRLGFQNYVTYSLYKHRRFGYDYKDIDQFRSNIIKYIIPLCHKITNWQKQELGINELKYYDTIYFSKMPNLLFKGEELLSKISNTFNSIDTELGNFYKNILNHGYIDLVHRDDKVNFAITNYLVETGLPVITGNFKDNYLDVSTVTHEVGHAFQKYCSSVLDKKYIVSSLLKYPTMEIAEMFSYAMELISIGHLRNLFNADDYKKFSVSKLYNLISMMPYICLVDEFQEKIYSKENLKVDDIRKIWLELVKKYHLEKSNSGHINLDTGGYFYRQSHIYLDPFYYIDYALSYFGAIALWTSCSNDLKSFKDIAQVASYYPFNQLIEKYHLPNPFNETIVQDISAKLEKKLILMKTNIK